MAIDMSQFIAVFFDETAEHLATMEAILLQLSLDEPDSEDLNAIFRAAHSIKGGAATFGFSDLAAVTHILENLLDRIRKNELALRAEMIDVFLRCGDVLQAILSAHRDGAYADPAAAEEITAQLEKFSSAAAGDIPVLQIRVSAGAGFDQVAVCRALAGYGELVAATDGGEQQDWVYQLITATPAGEIMATLAFAVDPARLSHQGVLAEVASPETAASLQDCDGYGFFSDETAGVTATLQDGDGYGFFSDEPAQEVSAGLQQANDFAAEATSLAPLQDGDGYGFFTEEPVLAALGLQGGEGYGFFSADAGPSSTEGYGFFTDIKAVEPPVETVTDGAGYGFFEPRPKVLAAVPQPLSEVLVSAPAAIRSAAVAKPAAPAADTSIRVSVEKVDQLLNLVGELVITQSMLVQTALNLDPVLHENMLAGVGQLERNTRELQESVMSIRMMPISFVFSRFPRLVRDLAGKLNKKIELKLIGETTELDKGFIEKLSDPLTHLVRNSLDHGIELPEERIAKGKSPTGTLTLRAFHQGGNIVIEVADDGAGLNRERILAKARERDIAVHDGMTDSEVWALIFEAGFSTAAQVTDVSGRGVGMDVVRRNIQSMGGRIEISSMFGIGSTMSIRLPLTLAILDGMSISVGDEIYLIPLAFIIESLQPRPDEVKTMAGKGRVINVRGEYLPLIALHEIFNVPPKVTLFHEGLVIILEAEGEKVAMFVDDLLGQHQVVVKNLETNYRKVPGVAGATIMGDGHVAFILDVAQLVHISQGLIRAVA